MISRLAAVLVAMVLAMCVGCAGPRAIGSSTTPAWERPGLGGAVRPEMGSPQPGEAAPELVLPDLEGKPVSLASMRGSWVLLHFTATWCPFCDSEVAHLGRVADDFAARGVKTVIVDVGEEAGVWKKYAAAHVAPSVVALHDATGATTARFAPPRAQPSFDDRSQAVLDGTLILDPSGKIRLFLLPDSAHFDPTFRAVRGELDRLVPPAIVGVSAPAAALTAGATAQLSVRLAIAAGYHVMSDRPSEPHYIATRVEIDPVPGVIAASASVYPAASSFLLAGAPISTFEGDVDVRVPVEIAPDAVAGTTHLHGRVRYQACTATRCLFPVTRPVDVLVTISRP